MTVINTNANALLTQNALKSNERLMSVAMERLSTGNRINSSKDDAAGLAISSRMTSQIRGLDMAVRNANDGISMIQAADGATIEISNMLQRMRELSVQAQNGTYTAATDLDYLQKEFYQLQLEIERIADNTQWNGKNILDGSPGTNGRVSFQVGANASQTITADFGNFQTKYTTNTFATSAVTNADNKFTLSNHGYVTGDKVIYDDGGGTVATGLADNTEYWVIKTDANNFTLASSYDNAIAGTVQAITGDGNNAQTLTKANTYSGSTANNIDGTTISVSSAANAATALAAIDTAITGLDSQRATYGSVINRLQYALDNLTNVSLNTSASRSQIQDADYAKETSELARTQIIQQAATAMLSQANTLPQSVLQLLQQ
jgi:flagellin